jgi:hypothetical protein
LTESVPVRLRGGILWNIGSFICGCNVSALLKLLFAIPFLTILASVEDRPLRDCALEGGCEFASVSVLSKLPVPGARLM